MSDQIWSVVIGSLIGFFASTLGIIVKDALDWKRIRNDRMYKESIDLKQQNIVMKKARFTDLSCYVSELSQVISRSIHLTSGDLYADYADQLGELVDLVSKAYLFGVAIVYGDQELEDYLTELLRMASRIEHVLNDILSKSPELRDTFPTQQDLNITYGRITQKIDSLSLG